MFEIDWLAFLCGLAGGLGVICLFIFWKWGR